jgi:hypothetical protein
MYVVYSPNPQGFQRFVAMDNDNKMMMHMLMKDEVGATADKQQRLLILTNLIRIRHQILTGPRRGGSRVGEAKNKDWHRLVFTMLLDSNYFKDDTTHTANDF